MNFNNFTIKSQEVIQKAIEITRNNGNQAIEPITIAKAIFQQGDTLVKFIFQKLGISANLVEQKIDKALLSLPKVSNGEPFLSATSNKVLECAINESQKFGDKFVSVEIIFLALLVEKSEASNILKDFGVNVNELTACIKELRKGRNVSDQ